MPFYGHGNGETMPRLNHGMARVEFLAVKPDVDELLAKGHPMTSVYRLLKDSGKISMCFESFKRHLRGPRQKPAPDKEAAAGMPATPPFSRHPRTEADAAVPEPALSDNAIDSTSRPRCPIITGADKKEGFGKDKIALEDLI